MCRVLGVLRWVVGWSVWEAVSMWEWKKRRDGRGALIFLGGFADCRCCRHSASVQVSSCSESECRRCSRRNVMDSSRRIHMPQTPGHTQDPGVSAPVHTRASGRSADAQGSHCGRLARDCPVCDDCDGCRCPNCLKACQGIPHGTLACLRRDPRSPASARRVDRPAPAFKFPSYSPRN